MSLERPRVYDIHEQAAHFNHDFEQALKFKMAVNDEDELNSLLAYYRDRINDINRERQEWLERLEECRLNQEEKHQLQWTMHKRSDEVVELQRTLTELKVHLFEERQQVLKLTRESDALKIRQIEDQKRIQELLALTEPVEEEIVLQKDVRPTVTHKYNKGDPKVHANKENYDKALKKIGGTGSAQLGGSGKSIVKTIYLPHEGINTITLENENLRRQLEQVQATFTQQVAALKNELEIRDQEMKIRYNADQEALETAVKRHQTLEKHHLALTKDYFQLRQKCNDSEQRLHEENELLRLRNTALANKLRIIEKTSVNDTRAAQELAEKRSEEYTSKFRRDLVKKEEDISIMKNQFQQAQKIYIGKVRDLEQTVARLADRLYNIERRKGLEIEGYKNEIRLLNRKIDKFETGEEQRDDLTSVPLQLGETERLEREALRDEARRKKVELAAERVRIYGRSGEGAAKSKTGKKSAQAKDSDQKKKGKKTGSQSLVEGSGKKQQVHRRQQNDELLQRKRRGRGDNDDNEDGQQQQHQQYSRGGDEERSSQEQSETVRLEELEDIKNQLDDLENQIDMARAV